MANYMHFQGEVVNFFLKEEGLRSESVNIVSVLVCLIQTPKIKYIFISVKFEDVTRRRLKS